MEPISEDIGMVYRVAMLLDKVQENPERFLPAQSFGMFKLGLIRIALGANSEGHDTCLHVWNKDLRESGVTDIHTHPWILRSRVLCGKITDTQYVANTAIAHQDSEPDELFWEYSIVPGEQPRVEEIRRVQLLQTQQSIIEAGRLYRRMPWDVHRTAYTDGTVTHVTKNRDQIPDSAFVYAQNNWVNAQPDEPDYFAAGYAIRMALLVLKHAYTL